MTMRASATSWSRRRGSRSRQRRRRSADGAGRPGGRRVQSGSARRTAASVSLTVSPAKRRFPGEHLPEDDAEGPDVGALVDRLAARLLGAHVGRGAEDHPGLGPLAAVIVGEREESLESRVAAARPQALARPKSRTLTLPSGVSLTLAGLRSRWTTPLPWASSSASAICRATASASSTASGPAREPLREVLARRPAPSPAHEAASLSSRP